MKNLYLVLIILLSTLFFSCRVQEDAIKKQVTYPSISSFQGSILGEEVDYPPPSDAWATDKWRTIQSYSFGVDTATNSHTYVTLGLEFGKLEGTANSASGKWFDITFPSFTSAQEARDVNYIMSNLIHVGKKHLLYNVSSLAPDGISKGTIDKFVLSFYDINTGTNENRAIFVSTIWGSQEGSIFEIVSSKEIEKSPIVGIENTFLITFNIDCQMYDKKGKYIGNIKGLLTYRWEYAPFGK